MPQPASIESEPPFPHLDDRSRSVAKGVLARRRKYVSKRVHGRRIRPIANTLSGRPPRASAQPGAHTGRRPHIAATASDERKFLCTCLSSRKPYLRPSMHWTSRRTCDVSGYPLSPPWMSGACALGSIEDMTVRYHIKIKAQTLRPPPAEDTIDEENGASKHGPCNGNKADRERRN